MATAVASGLSEIGIDDLSAGMVRNGPREAIPSKGAYDLTNVWLDETGKPNRRGGSAFKTAALGSGTRLYSLFDGFLGTEFRTVFTANTGKLYTLASDNTTVITVANWTGSTITKPVYVGDLVVAQTYASGNPTFILYAGSRKTTGYSAGSVSLNQGSRVATGSGTAWLANADAGMYFQRTGSSQVYEVQSVDSNTSITLDRPWDEGTVGGSTYTLTTTWTVAASNTLRNPDVGTTPKLAAVENRVAYTVAGQLGLSDINDPFTYTQGNYMDFGGTIVGMGVSRNVLLVFTSVGVFAVSGLASNQPADPAGNPQWRRELVNREVVAWTHEGITEWQGGVVVASLDGVWFVDAMSAPKLLSRSITDLYLSYVRTAGYRTGVAAIINGHYLLPILNSSDQWVDLLDLRLSTGAWTHHSGAGAKMALLAARKTTPPLLLGATENSGTGSTATRLYTLPYYQPSVSVKSDHDGTNHQASITTGDLEAPGDQAVMWKKARVWQEGTVDSGSPTVSVSYQRPQDGSATALNGSVQGAGASASTVTALSDASSYSWWGENIKRAKRIRFTVSTSGALSSWILHKLSVFYRQSGRQ